MKLFCALDRNRTCALRASTGSSYQTELQGQGTCAPTRIRAGGRRARSSGGGTRTRDHWLMKPALYHLSYARIHAANSALTRYVTLPVFTFVPAVGLEPTTFLMCPVYSRVPSPNSAALTHETRERPALGDECRTSLPRVSSGSRTRTYNLAVNSRLRYLLRHAGMIKHYAVFHASARRESNPHHPLRRRMLCPLSYRRLNWPHHSWRRDRL